MIEVEVPCMIGFRESMLELVMDRRSCGTGRKTDILRVIEKIGGIFYTFQEENYVIKFKLHHKRKNV